MTGGELIHAVDLWSVQRFWAKVDRRGPGDCWLWTGARNTQGYGHFRAAARLTKAHRFSYQLHYGEIPAGLEIDHLCRSRACVNPDHLEAVSHRENTRRSESPSARRARQTHCKRGHEFTPETAREAKERRKKTEPAAEAALHGAPAVAPAEAAPPSPEEQARAIDEKAGREIEGDIRRQLVAAGVPASQAEATARIEGARSMTRARLRGEEPLTVFRRRAIEIQAVTSPEPAPPAGALDQPGVTDSFERSGNSADDFILRNKRPAFGTITDEMARAIKMPEGPIILKVGTGVGRKRFGVEKIEKEHGREIRAAGYVSAEAFVADIADNFDAIYEYPAEPNTINIVKRTGRMGLVGITLQKLPGLNIWSPTTAFPIPKGWFAGKRLLWERHVITPPTTSGQPPSSLPTGPVQPPGAPRSPTARTDADKGRIPPPGGQVKPQSLEEFGEGGPRGRTIPERGRFLIKLFENRDASTAIHELGHVWLEDARSKELIALELGHRIQPAEGISFDTALFHNWYENLEANTSGTPFFETSPPPPHLVIPTFGGNELKGVTYGAEVAAHWRVLPEWQWNAGYSLLRLDLRVTDPAAQGAEDAEGHTARHKAFLHSSANLPGGFELDLAARYVSRLSTLDIPGYGELDARLAWKPSDHLELYVVGQNLLHRRHMEFDEVWDPDPALEASRGVYFGVTITD